MKIVIGSLKFSPVFRSHCLALGRQCERNGIEVIYLFSDRYKYLLSNDVISQCMFFNTSTKFTRLPIDCIKNMNNKKIYELFKIDGISHIYMFNYHPLNHKIAKYAKKNNVKYIQHLHEVSVDPTNYRFLYGYLVKALYEYLIDDLLNNCNSIVVSSKKVLDAFNHKYSKFAKIVKCIPLIYADTQLDPAISPQRKYVTFIGPPIPTKNIDLFYKLINYSIDNNLNYKFLIISREFIKLDDRLLSQTKLYFKKEITDEEIECLIMSSIAMIVPYKNISQSSNVNTSYRCGTPVVASDITGLRQFVIPGKTGCLVDLDAPIQSWANCLSFVVDNFNQLSEDSRNYYERNFAERNWNKYLADLFS